MDGKGIFNDKILVVVDKRQQAGAAAPGKQPGTTTAPVIKKGQRVQLTGKVAEAFQVLIE